MSDNVKHTIDAVKSLLDQPVGVLVSFVLSIALSGVAAHYAAGFYNDEFRRYVIPTAVFLTVFGCCLIVRKVFIASGQTESGELSPLELAVLVSHCPRYLQNGWIEPKKGEEAQACRNMERKGLLKHINSLPPRYVFASAKIESRLLDRVHAIQKELTR